MQINDIHFKLKDGRDAVLRSPREEDIESTIEYLRLSAAETDFLLRTPEECGDYTYEGEKALFERKNASPNEVMLVCVVDGKVAGNCGISYFNNIKRRHRATIALALISEFWGQGIGTRMFVEMERIARNCWPQVVQLELGFIEGNDRARHLYEKQGFRITGVNFNAYRMRDGSLRNEYLMIKELY